MPLPSVEHQGVLPSDMFLQANPILYDFMFIKGIFLQMLQLMAESLS